MGEHLMASGSSGVLAGCFFGFLLLLLFFNNIAIARSAKLFLCTAGIVVLITKVSTEEMPMTGALGMSTRSEIKVHT